MMARANPAKPKKTKNAKQPERWRHLFYCILFALIVSIAITGFLYYYGTIDENTANSISSIALSLIFAFIVFSYLLAKGKNLREIADELGISLRHLTKRYAALGFLLFLLFMFIEFGTALFSTITGIQLPTNVAATLAGMPVYFYVFAFLVAPITEEILFRGFLVSRMGIIGSSLVFAVLHYISYFSAIEFVAAFAFAIASAFIFKKTRSLYPSMIGHALIDFVGIVATFFV